MERGEPGALDGGLLSPTRQVVVAGWTGSANLGDEMLLDALVRRLTPLGVAARPISIDAAATRADHGLEVVAERRPRDVLGALREADGLILGPGGLLQDDSSVLNPARHLARVAAARRAGRPVLGFGLGVGPLSHGVNRRMAARALRDVEVVVRDARSAATLAGLGHPGAIVTADLVLGTTPPPDTPPGDHVVVCLRPPTARRFVPQTRAQVRERMTAPARAHAVDALVGLSRRLDLGVRLVAFEAGRDDVVAQAVAEALADRGVPVEVSVPTRHEVLAEVATGRLVVSMRYHGGIAAVLAGRPTVLIGHVDKVRSLAEEAGVPGVVGLDHDGAGWAALADAASAALAHADSVAEAHARLRAREAANGDHLARWVDAL